MLCKQGSLSKILHGVVQGLRKGLDKGTAAGGTCFVQLYAVYGLIFDLDALHVLTADVQDTVDAGIEKSSGIVMCHGLYFTVI